MEFDRGQWYRGRVMASPTGIGAAAGAAAAGAAASAADAADAVFTVEFEDGQVLPDAKLAELHLPAEGGSDDDDDDDAAAANATPAVRSPAHDGAAAASPQANTAPVLADFQPCHQLVAAAPPGPLEAASAAASTAPSTQQRDKASIEATRREEQEKARIAIEASIEATRREEQEEARRAIEASTEATRREEREKARRKIEASIEATRREEQEKARLQIEATRREEQEKARHEIEASIEATRREEQEKARRAVEALRPPVIDVLDDSGAESEHRISPSPLAAERGNAHPLRERRRMESFVPHEGGGLKRRSQAPPDDAAGSMRRPRCELEKDVYLDRGSDVEKEEEEDDDEGASARRRKKGPRGKPVEQLGTNGNVIRTFATAVEAFQVTGTHNASISQACNGKIPYAGGFQWRFKPS